MKNKQFLAVVWIVSVCFACNSPKYLPHYDTIDVNPYGCFIKIFMNNGPTMAGELIAVDSNQLMVLSDNTFHKTLLFAPIKQIKGFTVYYAKPKNLAWSIPVFTLSTLLPFPDPANSGGWMPLHGYFAGVTVPVNLIVTAIIASRNPFKYETLSYMELKMFARFPQGISPDINIKNIQ